MASSGRVARAAALPLRLTPLRPLPLQLLMMVLINFSNLFCHSLFSILPPFFPQQAKAKGMSQDAVGIVFACFPAVIFLTSPFAGPFMTRHGKKWVYTTGLIIVSASTICFSVASYLPEGSPFATWCLFIRLLQV
jgi:MFS family permease